MSVTYNLATINARLQAVADQIDGGGGPAILLVRAGGTTLSTIVLAQPCGTVNGGVLTFQGTLIDVSAAATGLADNVMITDSNGVAVVSGLSVGTPLSSGEVIIVNGLNTTEITAGQVVQLLSAQITGS